MKQIKVAKLPVAASLNTWGDEWTTMAIVDANTEKILGCTLFWVDSDEMINTIQVAINAGLRFQVLRGSIFTHPSMTEVFNDLFSII